MNRDEWNERLEAVGRELAGRGASASLTVVGALPGILAGQPARTSTGLDVWRPSSTFERASLRASVEAAGLLYNARGREPGAPGVRVVDPGIVQMSMFEPELVDQYGALRLSRAPAANLIASKLGEAGESDLCDIAWLMANYRPDPEEVRRIVKTFPRQARGRATGNLVYLRFVEPMEEVWTDLDGHGAGFRSLGNGPGAGKVR